MTLIKMPALDENKQINREWANRLVAAKCVWLWIQSLVLVFKKEGIKGSAKLLAEFDGDAESLKNLAYRLYNICDKRNLAKEAASYNEIVVEWQAILGDSVKFKRKDQTVEINLF